jgi:hypothetical protein
VSGSRLSSPVRGFIIAAILAVYGFVVREPAASLTASLLLAVALQITIIVLRKWLPADRHPQAQQIVELVFDGATVFLFALGVYGGILQTGTAF